MVERNYEISVKYSSNQLNSSMKLIFDTLTPRPHFIIIQHEEYQKINVSDKQIKETMELVVDFLVHKPEYDNNAILSFHRGAWYQKKHKYFHAHLCVPKKPYCKEIEMMMQINDGLCSTDYLDQLHEDYILSKMKYNYYRDKCISNAYLCFYDSIAIKVPLDQFNTSKFTLVFLASTPRIGILANNLNIELKVLYNFMNNFYLSARKKLALVNPLYENFGVHLCLYVSGKKKQINTQLTQRNDQVLVNDIIPIKLERIVGYIQLDEELYLRWLPRIFHRTWLNQFKNKQHIVVT